MPENSKIDYKFPETSAGKIRNEKILSLLGFAMRAGRLVCGTDKVCDNIRRNGCPLTNMNHKNYVGIVLIAEDASDNTIKRITNACNYYNINYIKSNISSKEFGHRLGKGTSVAVCATFDRNFSLGIAKAAGGSNGSRPARV